MGVTIDDVLLRLEKVRTVRKAEQWTARCPAHDDRNPSLSVRLTREGKLLFNCHAQGCSFQSIMFALGLDGSTAKRSGNPLGLANATHVYDYRDERGKVLYKVARYTNPKSFRPWQPDGLSGWEMRLGGSTPRVPYNLPVLLDNPSEIVLWVEGEKDVDRAADAGLLATTTQGGANGLRSSIGAMRKHLAGRRVVIIPDADDPGDAYAEQALAAIKGAAASASILTLPGLEHRRDHGEDLSDWLDRHGHTIDELRAAIKAAMPMANDAPPKVTPIRPDVAKPRTDGTAALKDPPPDEPAKKAKRAKEKIPLTLILAQAIAGEGEHFAVDAGGKLWAYVGGVYVPNGKSIVHRHVKRLLTGPLDMPDKWTSHQADEVVAFISVDAPALWEKPRLDRINLRNGILSVKTRKLAPHSPEFLSPVQLPISYDPAAVCHEIEKFALEVFPEDAIELAWEIPAWLMTPDTSIQKAIMLTGPGGNGKSTWLDLLVTFLGRQNTSSKSLQKMESDRFAASGLVGKMANICADLPSAALVGTSMFKAITGGDMIPAEYKYGDPFDFIPFSRLLFSANQPPRSPDSSQGFYDRWVVIPFVGRFRESDEEVGRSEMHAKLTSDTELSGLLNRALDALPRLRKSGRFTTSSSTQTALAEFRDMTDPFTIWLDGECVDDPEGITPKEDLRASYARHCAKAGHATPGAESFGLMLLKARPSITKAQRTLRGKLMWCYIGISLRSD